MATYYVAWSSWFDTHPYDVSKITAALKAVGATDIHTENDKGQSNQPEVVVFKHSDDVKRFSEAFEKEMGTEWVTVKKKDWKTKKLAKGGAAQEGDRVIITTSSLGKKYEGMSGEITARKLLNDKYSIKLEDGMEMAFSKDEFRHNSINPKYRKGGEVKLSPLENARLDVLQKREDLDMLTKSENAEYEALVKKYRKTAAYKKAQSKKYAEGGAPAADFDWNKLYEPLSKEEEAILDAKAKTEKEKERVDEKNAWAKQIRAKGKDWNEAFLNRVNSAKHNVDKLIEWHNKIGISEKTKAYSAYAKEDIDSIKELKFEAVKYAENLEKKLKEFHNTMFTSSNKKAKGGKVKCKNEGVSILISDRTDIMKKGGQTEGFIYTIGGL